MSANDRIKAASVKGAGDSLHPSGSDAALARGYPLRGQRPLLRHDPPLDPIPSPRRTDLRSQSALGPNPSTPKDRPPAAIRRWPESRL